MGVQRARDYIIAHLAEPINLSDLCGQTHMEARALEYGFHEIVGLSPINYLRMLRLGEVHRRLLCAVSHRRTISELALDAGFWHFGQFAVDYKKLFMESPSVTRKRLTGHWREPRCDYLIDQGARQGEY
jgi:AraC family ethanolamine operon transcriptional activator